MYRVRSEFPDRIPLSELSDCIYYRQEKVFSDAEYDKCQSLQRAIAKGQILVLDRKPEKDSQFNIHTSNSVPVNQPIAPDPQAPPVDMTAYNAHLFEYLKSLESKIDKMKSSPSDSEKSSSNDSNLVNLLTQKIEALEKKLEDKPTSIPKDTSDTLQKLDELLTKFSSGTVSVPNPVKEDKKEEDPQDTIQQEIYVPSVRVEDGNSHINLKIRTVESGDSVSSASAALKRLKEGK